MSPPIMHISMAVSPSVFSLGESCSLAITATLQHTEPITIYTRGSIFDTAFPRNINCFFCVDLSDDNVPIQPGMKAAPEQAGLTDTSLGGRDDQVLVTFHPNTPVTITDKFVLTAWTDRALERGHRYQFGIHQSRLSWHWKPGTREQVMTIEGRQFRQDGLPQIVVPPCGGAQLAVNEQRTMPTMAAPALRISLVISPPIFSIGDRCTLIMTATLEYPVPITIHIPNSILDIHKSQKMSEYFCFDLTEGIKIISNIDIPGRHSGGVSRQLGGSDDENLITLFPDTPLTSTDDFALAAQLKWLLKPGHRYRFGVSRSVQLFRWMHGTRDVLMTAEPQFFGMESMPAVQVVPGAVVEFMVN